MNTSTCAESCAIVWMKYEDSKTPPFPGGPGLAGILAAVRHAHQSPHSPHSDRGWRSIHSRTAEGFDRPLFCQLMARPGQYRLGLDQDLAMCAVDLDMVRARVARLVAEPGVCDARPIGRRTDHIQLSGLANFQKAFVHAMRFPRAKS